LPTWKFGRRFLLQFFVSPFQFFILPVWGLAYFSARTGIMAMRSGPAVRRDQDPGGFRRNLWACILITDGSRDVRGSWTVVSRQLSLAASLEQ
jgi:hypothetical protein